ncbi:MAG: GH92 family glycosyl hydrolase [Luteolibacter sp.]
MTEKPTDLPLVSHVDPFLGNAAADLPKPEGIAVMWWCAKPPVGNTHPGATLPFGMVSACAYSGAYVTGYGRYGLSLSGDAPPVMYDRHEALGIAHFQQSGTGRIRMYYNYLLTTPLAGEEIDGRLTRCGLVEERAWPGFYAGKFEETGIAFEVVAMERGVRHRYIFPEGISPKVVVDVSAGGLLLDDMGNYPQWASITILEDGSVAGEVVMEGIPVKFRCKCAGAKAFLWEDEDEIDEGEYVLDLGKQKNRPTFGFGFKGDVGSELELVFGFSLRMDEWADAGADAEGNFSDKVTKAAGIWEETLGKIEVSGGTSEQNQIFETAVYHACLKPADFTNENPFTGKDGPFFFDLSTLWDSYKTQLPLMMTLFPERGAAFVEFLCEVAQREGGFPVSYLMDNAPDRFTKQATGLCHMILEDARCRGIEADWDRVLSLLWKTSQSGKGRRSRFGEYGRTFIATPLSHTLDISYAHFCMARMARATGVQSIHDKAAALAVHWRNAFDEKTGLLREDSTYYEGENWNYSFRFLHEMGARIELAGGEKGFVKLLDKFFGFVDAGHGERIFRFEGLNNEPDMESPYAYLYAGRHDRTARVVRRVMQCQFATGVGGLAGNEDSGGLSSWYVWNACGLFPVTGQPVMLIGSPIFEKAVFHLKGGDFIVETEGNSDENVFVQQAFLNGKEISRSWLKMDEFQRGGTLKLVMGGSPSEFGNHERPPTYDA